MPKKILIIATGGTIASTDEGAGLQPTLDVGKLLTYLPELPEGCSVDGIQLFHMDSTNVGRLQWNQIVAKIESVYQEYDGFVIVHGTDTLAYTASALSYLIQGNEKPVVLTGAQRPLMESGSDGVKNLYDSICVAMEDEKCGVVVVFDGDVIVGTRAKKTRTRTDHAIESVNYPVLAKVKDGTVTWEQKLDSYVKQTRMFEGKAPSIHLIKLTPFTNGELLELVFHNYNCVVIEGFGSGNIPETLYEDMKLLSYRYDTLVIIGTQVPYEGTDMKTYVAGRKFLELPQVIEAKDMTTESIIAKMMWIQGERGLSLEEQKEKFIKPIHFDRTN